MSILANYVKSGDWKGEKHVPAIIVKDTIKAGEVAQIKVCVGEEIAHPNTLEHHISWIKLFFVPEGGQIVELASNEYSANGELECFSEPTLFASVQAQCATNRCAFHATLARALAFFDWAHAPPVYALCWRVVWAWWRILWVRKYKIFRGELHRVWRVVSCFRQIRFRHEMDVAGCLKQVFAVCGEAFCWWWK